ncbi:MAG TPA: alpha/beta hydrolase [Vicinamibacteria bacterium]
MRVFPPRRRMLIFFAVLILGLLLVPVLFEKRLIYFPFRDLEVTPKELGLRYEEARLVAEDGVTLHGWFLPVEGSRFTVLVCHGNAGNISHRLDRALLMHAKLKTDVFLFDYRGYGLSEGAPDEQGTYRDARAAHRYLSTARGVVPGSLIIFGESLGAAVALQLALEVPARALVLEAPFTSIADMAGSVLPFLPVGRLLRTRYDNLAKIGGLRMPLLVLHGDRDTTVPFAQGRRLFEAAPEPKQFFPIPGAGHNDTYFIGGDAYWQAWSEFLEELAEAGGGR